MSSIKKLKSKGKAVLFDPMGREYSVEYAFRKRQFADTPPAKLVKPLKALRAVAAQSFDRLRHALVVAKGDESAPFVADARAGFIFDRTLVTVGRHLAAQGNGVALHNFAVRYIA